MQRCKKRKELGIPLDSFLIVSVGELNENKNHKVIIKALAKLADKNIHYVIAGKGPLKESLQVMSSEMGIASKVHMLGYRTDIPELYAAADLCAFPSIREGQGLAAIEGMASTLPLIVSDNRGTRGFVNEENGITCHFDDVTAFSEGISDLITNWQVRNEMAKANRRKCKKFDKKVVNIEMEKIYLSII